MLPQQNFEINSPSKKDKKLAQSSVDVLKNLNVGKNSAKLLINETQVELPVSAVKLLLEALGQLAQGNALTMIPRHASLTTQEAADLLNVSRPYLVKLLDSGEIPFTRTGNRRKILAEDLFRFKNLTTKRSNQAIDELVEQAQNLGMDYE